MIIISMLAREELSGRFDIICTVDQILALFTSNPMWKDIDRSFPSLDGIVVDERCKVPDYKLACPSNCHDCENLTGEVNAWECATEGTITRQAEWKEVIEWIKETLEIAEGHEMYEFVGVMKSGGRLKIREKD